MHIHPWFRMPSLKRKTYQRDSASSSPSGDSGYEAAYPRPVKRLRCGVLETGFAQLSLDASQGTLREYDRHASPPSLQSSDMHAALDFEPEVQMAPTTVSPPSASMDTTWDQGAGSINSVSPHYLPVVLPDSVEEPTSPDSQQVQVLPDVTMKSRSWYEPTKDRT